MKAARSFTTLVLSLGLAATAFAFSPQGQSGEKHGQGDKDAKHSGSAKQAKPAKPAKAGKAAAHAQPEERAHRRPQQARATRVDNRPPGWDKGKKVGWNGGSVPPGHQTRLPRDRQRELIAEQRQRVVDYRRHLEEQRAAAQRYSAQLQQDRRLASYRYQQAYLARIRQQRLALQRTRNYYNDPYYYTAPSYRYDRGGTSYETNQYGADVLRKALNNGYEQGFRSGQAARQDQWTAGYEDSYAYQDANYGYDGYYGDQDSYNYYFRQGFAKGYDDGYNSRSQFGSVANGRHNLLTNVLQGILNLQSLR
jgi:hypothetical protein